MPKPTPTTEVWQKRLTGYAHGTFKFGRGEKPRKTSKWAKELDKIDKCPIFRSPTGRNIFGNVLVCSCGWHHQQAQRHAASQRGSATTQPMVGTPQAPSTHPNPFLQRPGVGNQRPIEATSQPSAGAPSTQRNPYLQRPTSTTSRSPSVTSSTVSQVTAAGIQQAKRFVSTDFAGASSSGTSRLKPTPNVRIARPSNKRFKPFIPPASASPGPPPLTPQRASDQQLDTQSSSVPRPLSIGPVNYPPPGLVRSPQAPKLTPQKPQQVQVVSRTVSYTTPSDIGPARSPPPIPIRSLPEPNVTPQNSQQVEEVSRTASTTLTDTSSSSILAPQQLSVQTSPKSQPMQIYLEDRELTAEESQTLLPILQQLSKHSQGNMIRTPSSASSDMLLVPPKASPDVLLVPPETSPASPDMLPAEASSASSEVLLVPPETSPASSEVLLVPPETAAEPLLPPNERPISPVAHQHEVMQISDEEDTRGKAVVRQPATQQQADVTVEPEQTLVIPPLVVTTPSTNKESKSRTTKWRHKGKPKMKERKAYTCSICTQVASIAHGHSQYRGKRYCPNAEGAPTLTVWLEARRKESAERKAAKEAAKESAQGDDTSAGKGESTQQGDDTSAGKVLEVNELGSHK